MSNHIGKRNIGKVRSHLQKYLLKQRKIKEKNKNKSDKVKDNKSKIIELNEDDENKKEINGNND